ncbi:MAG: hypothetical protein ABW208_24750 [Pyrinomonadaceae bacterium]
MGVRGSGWFYELLSTILSWAGYLLLTALFFYGVYEAYHYYGWLRAVITAIPLVGQIYWFLTRWWAVGFLTWFTYAYVIAAGCILGAYVFMRLYQSHSRRPRACSKASVPSEVSSEAGIVPSESIPVVGWMPAIEPDGDMTEMRRILGAIRVARGQEFSNVATYLYHLADRVQEMIEREENPRRALAELTRWLESEGLMGQTPQSLDDAGWALVVENPALRMRLGMLGIPGELPEKITSGNPEALRIVEETTLEAWVTLLTVGFNECLA